MNINTTLTLKDLPSPPESKTGWPWTEQTEPLSKIMLNGCEWPRISIVTPSYNQGQFIEETIRSVLLQGYPNLEYIIIDGGSVDNTIDIIRKYEQWISYWVSEPDRGQTDAIQKGFERCTGVIWNWLNSDDLLEVNALQAIAKANLQEPLSTVYSGKLNIFDNSNPSLTYLHIERFQKISDLICVWEKWGNPQPVTYMSCSACHLVGGLDVSLKYTMDYELYLRLALLPNFKVKLIDNTLAKFRLHSDSKTVSQQIAFKSEIAQVFDKFANQHPAIMPKGWRSSRSRFQFHLVLDQLSSHYSHKIPLTEFIQQSFSLLPHIWNYRFFWAYLFSYLKSLQILPKAS
ncbi:putative glycosyltransferase [Nostoc commune NIES-4072]|uniref:Putative glycosyltransferase n=1 Tax=Nostoc commune NIES-4072 TaxID=2005467 RepID=A0A2R5FNH4_NOSCO|nr:glycosyltransferase family 2 protein [Nostoc commune]BBD69177.1 putative glycosyltransferase [Nostoc commune HK-02]GBG19825.1 putative glycosyltransferase [Nostoc commune NIES-4072]